MKIAIPTNDGLTLASGIDEATAFLVLTLELGEIIHQEKRFIVEKENPGNRMKPDDKIPDCAAIIMNEVIMNKEDFYLQGKEIIKSTDTIITKAIMHWLSAELSKEANTCCCP